MAFTNMLLLEELLFESSGELIEFSGMFNLNFISYFSSNL